MVLVVSDNRLYREGVAALLAQSQDVYLVGTAPSSAAAAGAMASASVDVVLVDMTMLDAVSTVRAIVAADGSPKVVASSLSGAEPEIVAAAEAGVVGFVDRTSSLEDVVATIASVARNETALASPIAEVLLQRLTALVAEQEPPSAAQLTPRECEILLLIAEGFSNKQIAARLYIELTTVKNHVHRILRKLNVARRGEAAALVSRKTRIQV